MASDTANLIVCSSKPKIMPYIFNFMMVFLSKTAVALCFLTKERKGSMANSTLISISETDISLQTDVFLLLATDVIKIHLYLYLIFLRNLTLLSNGKKKKIRMLRMLLSPVSVGILPIITSFRHSKREAKIPNKSFSLLEKKITVSRNQILKDLGMPLQLETA